MHDWLGRWNSYELSFRLHRLACSTEAVRRQEAELKRTISSFPLAANSFLFFLFNRFQRLNINILYAIIFFALDNLFKNR